MKKIGILLILSALALALTMALTGCGSKEATTSQSSTTPASTETATTTPASSTPATQEPATSETPAAQAETTAHTTTPAEPPVVSPQETTTPEAPAVQPEVSAPSVSDEATDPSATFSRSIQALESLSSYRYTTTMKYEGTGDAAADSGTVKVQGEYCAPDRHRLVVNDSSDGEKSEFIMIGDSLWVSNEGQWTKVPDMAVPAMSQSIFNFGLSFIWGSLAEGLETGANFAGKETVNGIKSLHYSSANSNWERAMGAEFQNAHGDVWVAEAGYPVRFVFIASGTDEDGSSGSIEWTSNVTDVNAEVTISAPIPE